MVKSGIWKYFLGLIIFGLKLLFILNDCVLIYNFFLVLFVVC